MYKNQTRAVFLDRDGVICEEKNLLHKKEDFVLILGAAEAIHLLNKQGYLTVVITNQPVIARGLCTLVQLEEIHKHMRKLLAKSGAHLDAIYYCPHHPSKGNDPLYTRKCECRKPKVGMILQAKKDFNLTDTSECYVVGDSTSDIKAGDAAGCKTILVESNRKDPFNDAVPHFKAKNLYDAVTNIILKDEIIN